MSEKKAKAIRKLLVRGGSDIYAERTYKKQKHRAGFLESSGLKAFVPKVRYTVFNAPGRPRARYQRLKKALHVPGMNYKYSRLLRSMSPKYRKGVDHEQT